MSRNADEISIVVSVNTGRRAASVSGRVESPFGRRTFSGWLDLLGQLEEVVERARVQSRQGEPLSARGEPDDPS